MRQSDLGCEWRTTTAFASESISPQDANLQLLSDSEVLNGL